MIKSELLKRDVAGRDKPHRTVHRVYPRSVLRDYEDDLIKFNHVDLRVLFVALCHIFIHHLFKARPNGPTDAKRAKRNGIYTPNVYYIKKLKEKSRSR